MTEETLQRASEIKREIEALNVQIKEFPRYIVDQREYEKSGRKHMYAKRLFVKERYKIKIPKGYFAKDLEFELSEEDLQALVDIRQRKADELKKRLSELT